MTITTTIRRSIGAALAVAAAITTTLAPTPAPANAAIGSMSATQTIWRLPGTARACSVRVEGVVRMTQAEANDLLNRQDYRVIFRIWGDDPVSDDFIAGPEPASVEATSQGIRFNGSRGLPCSWLDEDGGTFDAEGDEIYSGVRLVKGYLNGQYGPTLRSAETNRTYSRF